MDYLTFFFAILHVYRALCEEMVWDTTVKLAENMSLECIYSSLDTLVQLEWHKITTTNRELMAIFSPTYGLSVKPPYTERVSFLNSTMAPNDMTLSFHNVSEADVGFYSCFLHTFPQGHWEKVIQVVASEMQARSGLLPVHLYHEGISLTHFSCRRVFSSVPHLSFEIAVPSRNHIVSEPGKNVTLTCQLPQKGPVQQVTWEKIQPHQIDLLTSCNLSQGKGYASKYQRQILSNCSPGMTSSFILMPHVMASDSGLYRCCFKASTGDNGTLETIAMRLTVTDGKTDNQYTLFVAGGAVLLLLFVVLITTVTVISSKRRRSQKKLFKDSCDAQKKAANNYRNPDSTNQSSDGAREDIYVNYPAFSQRPKTRI
ncbi:CD226 antigen isoform X1 [Mustela erminea]|uniref:CD226 antigen isoform X1 n=1 Tax=Mustela erminea TaxID=36723 RepID=UPI001386D102|nr:CD226 antigen isoform X1 [Mustela erminea]XP_032166048.1 CD226 antigen isoform X1 [Mustela erminea]XP_032166049.1 CD226 antigen isoform X1 [Mustela erminea]